MPRWEQAHHLAYLRMHPPMDQMLNLTNALQCMVIANSAFGSKGRHKLKDFLLDFNAERKPKTPAEQKAMWLGWCAAANAKGN